MPSRPIPAPSPFLALPSPPIPEPSPSLALPSPPRPEPSMPSRPIPSQEKLASWAKIKLDLLQKDQESSQGEPFNFDNQYELSKFYFTLYEKFIKEQRENPNDLNAIKKLEALENEAFKRHILALKNKMPSPFMPSPPRPEPDLALWAKKELDEMQKKEEVRRGEPFNFDNQYELRKFYFTLYKNFIKEQRKNPNDLYAIKKLEALENEAFERYTLAFDNKMPSPPMSSEDLALWAKKKLDDLQKVEESSRGKPFTNQELYRFYSGLFFVVFKNKISEEKEKNPNNVDNIKKYEALAKEADNRQALAYDKIMVPPPDPSLLSYISKEGRALIAGIPYHFNFGETSEILAASLRVPESTFDKEWVRNVLRKAKEKNEPKIKALIDYFIKHASEEDYQNLRDNAKIRDSGFKFKFGRFKFVHG